MTEADAMALSETPVSTLRALSSAFDEMLGLRPDVRTSADNEEGDGESELRKMRSTERGRGAE